MYQLNNMYMKRIYNSLFAGLMACTMLGMAGCSDDPASEEPDFVSKKEQTLQKAVAPYVDHIVLPTYKGMADAAIELYDDCVALQNSFAEGKLTVAEVVKAGEAWKASRKYWELSEAFLFGPAATHNIDPHIDSWPLDKIAMDALLADIRAGKPWDIANNAGYGLLGFHSIEYVLFQLSADGTTSHPHDPATYTAEELEYLVAVAEDLRAQCVTLEACWAGTENLSEAKRAILEEAGLDYGENYGEMMKSAGKPGSIFKSYQDVAEEIIQGCIDIADEVGNTKIGRPNTASTLADRNYIESPYSLNSIEDFQDNIRSIQRSYFGTQDGDASISDYIRSVNPGLDDDVRAAIEASLAAIGRIPEPFAHHATENEATEAVRVVGTDLVDVLTRVMVELGR